MRKLLIASTLLMLPAGCSWFGPGQPQFINEPPPGITFRAEHGDVSSTQQEAEKYCGRYKKKPEVQKTENSGGNTLVTYRCE